MFVLAPLSLSVPHKWCRQAPACVHCFQVGGAHARHEQAAVLPAASDAETKLKVYFDSMRLWNDDVTQQGVALFARASQEAAKNIQPELVVLEGILRQETDAVQRLRS